MPKQLAVASKVGATGHTHKHVRMRTGVHALTHARVHTHHAPKGGIASKKLSQVMAEEEVKEEESPPMFLLVKVVGSKNPPLEVEVPPGFSTGDLRAAVVSVRGRDQS